MLNSGIKSDKISSQLFNNMDKLDEVKGLVAHTFISNEYILRGVAEDSVSIDSFLSGYQDNHTMILKEMENLRFNLKQVLTRLQEQDL